MTMSSSEARVKRVLVVDDSALMRALLSEYIRSLDEFEVAGEAATGYQAIRLVHELDPDLVTLDLEMPDLGGLETLGYIMSEMPRPVVIVSAHTEALADPALNAMLHGAIEFVPKPASREPEDRSLFRLRFEQALRTAALARLLKIPQRRLAAQRRTTAPRDQRPARCVVAVAASTGGPRALSDVIPRLPADTPAAIIIVQHMPPMFTTALARRLEQTAALPVREAEDGALVLEGVVYVAPGGLHLELDRHDDGVRFRLTDAPPLWGVRPAADVLFAAVARTYGPGSIGVVLTGMGRDGADGLRAIHEVGGWTVVQDEATCVIPSMPRAAAPYADVTLPLADIVDEVVGRAADRVQLRPG
jgi:two-component system chemotaxis response regulator CheB